MIFLTACFTSKYDLIWFSKKQRTQMRKHFGELARHKPPVDGPPLD
jgi:hypothetical protein